MAEDTIKLEMQKMDFGGSIQKDENLMATILQRMGDVFSNEYEEIEITVSGEKRKCYKMKNGVIFEVIGILPFNCFTVSYADNLTAAKKDWFEEGDQFDAWQDFDTLVRQIREELKGEEKE